jgi:glucose-1-phosphate thymidylyltransferase
MVIRDGKWDIPQYFADGRSLDMDLAYVVIRDSSGPPDTVNRAYPFIAGKTVAFGFPDIILEPSDVFCRLVHHVKRRNCDLVLGLFPAHDCRAMDMVDVDQEGKVRQLFLKPRRTSLRYAWVCAVWRPTFTDFLHVSVSSMRGPHGIRLRPNRKIDAQGDVPVGAVIKAAVRQGLSVESVTFPQGSYLDIGTPADLRTAVRTYR